jgi:hypothetical protein
MAAATKASVATSRRDRRADGEGRQVERVRVQLTQRERSGDDRPQQP